jgi:hypothetical protein
VQGTLIYREGVNTTRVLTQQVNRQVKNRSIY